MNQNKDKNAPADKAEVHRDFMEEYGSRGGALQLLLFETLYMRSDVRGPTTIKNAANGIKRLDEARKSAQNVHRELEERRASFAAQRRHLKGLVSGFIVRRDQLLTSAEADPDQSAHAAELARTAERLRGRVQHSLDQLIEPHAVAVADEKKAQTVLSRIDAATERLAAAAENLRLAQLEEQGRKKLAELERSSMNQLQQMGKARNASGTYVPLTLLNTASNELDMQLRDVTRLTYEAEALAELQRDRLK